MKGTLEWFNATTGSGFVTSVDHGEFLYFLQPSLKSHEISGDQNLKVGEAVEFGIMGDRYGSILERFLLFIRCPFSSLTTYLY
jgi:cold shock CspA family protein